MAGYKQPCIHCGTFIDSDARFCIGCGSMSPFGYHCPTCNRPIQKGQSVCSGCARPLYVVCPACGQENAPGTKFCGGCGARLEG